MLSRIPLYLVLLLVACTNVQAEAPVIRGLAVLEDRAGVETIDSIANGDPARFRSLSRNMFNGGYTRSVHWFRLDIEAMKGEVWLEVLPPFLDDIRLYQSEAEDPRHFVERRAGDTLPFSEREVVYRGYVFKLQQRETGLKTVYLRLETTSSSMLSARVWSPENFLSETSVEYALLAGTIAVALTILVLNLNAWWWLHDRLTLWFIGYLAAICYLFAANAGFVQQYLHPESPSANQWALALASIAGVVFSNGFGRRLFRIGRGQPLAHWTYVGVSWFALLCLIPALIGYYREVQASLSMIGLLMSVLGYWLSIRHWMQRNPGRTMILLANLIGMLGLIVFVLQLQGFLPGSVAGLNALHISTLGSIVALQIAIGQRLRVMRDARLRAERDAEQQRAIREEQGRFLSMLAHELRTSLSVLKMVIGGRSISPKRIAIAERAMIGMEEVIERSLQAEMLFDGSLKLEALPCDVMTQLEGVIADNVESRRFHLSADGRPTITTDGKLVRVIITNLIDNAAKYSESGSYVRVEVSADPKLTLRVTNRIKPEGAPDPGKVFDKYYRGPRTGEKAGSGVGLYISQGIATRLGGAISCDLRDGEVSFSLTLPSIA